MKHNISITMDSQLFREIENTRGREKRSTFIEHLILLGLKAYRNKNGEFATKPQTPVAFLSPVSLNHTRQ
jgi:metal-responsive CopG/Arc/MetJ family transcriptional regulator